MPDISEDGKIIFSLYQDGGYKISVLEQAIYINDDFVGYDKNYFLNNEGMTPPINKLNLTKSKKYEISFLICLLLKLMLDYGTLKSGFYFQSSEIIDRLSLLERPQSIG